ncbi:MAG TPA: NAD(P)H-dependent oxidoreductase [Rhizomicrobium sp.]|nr:NAD(P)H-dependent oxidoreductase [Rhizomicrobium sp.]
MKHAVIVAHPKVASFSMSVAKAYCEAAGRAGHDVLLRDLYRMNFAPCLEANEMPNTPSFAPASDVMSERQLLADVNVFAFVYPLWMNAQPAMMKGYIDRVFGMGFAYGSGRGGNVPLLKSRKMISFTSSGAPTGWVISTGAWSAVQKLFDEHFSQVCGLELIDHIHFGGIVPGIRSDAVETHLTRVRAAVDLMSESEGKLSVH